VPAATTETKLPAAQKEDQPLRVMGLSKAILSVLVNRFCVRTTDLYRLVPQTAANQEDHERQIRAAVKRLRDHKAGNDWGYIRSVPWTDPTVESKFIYSCHAHVLTNRGVQLVRSHDLDLQNNAKSGQEISPDHIDHEIRIYEFLDTLEARLQKEGLELIVFQINLQKLYRGHNIRLDHRLCHVR